MSNQVVPSPLGTIPENSASSAVPAMGTSNLELKYINGEWVLTDGRSSRTLAEPPSAYPGSFPGMWHLQNGIITPVGLTEPQMNAHDLLYNQPLNADVPQTGSMPGSTVAPGPESTACVTIMKPDVVVYNTSFWICLVLVSPLESLEIPLMQGALQKFQTQMLLLFLNKMANIISMIPKLVKADPYAQLQQLREPKLSTYSEFTYVV